MKKLFYELRYDIKGMGLNFWIPPILCVAFILISIPVIVGCNIRGGGNIYTLPLMETFLPVMGAFWSIFSLQDILEEGGGEIYFSYHRKRVYWGIYRQLRYGLMYVILIAVTCCAIGLLLRQDFFRVQFWLYCAQGFFMSGLGFCSMCFFKKTGDSFVVIAMYVSAHLLFGSHELAQYTSVYLGNDEYAVANYREAELLIIRALAFGIVCFWCGHIKISLM